MSGKTVEVQDTPDPLPLAGQRPGPPFFGILLLAGLIVIGAGAQATASLIAPVFLVITLVITVAPLRTWLVQRGLPGWAAGVAVLLTIYALLALILGSVVFALVRLVGQLDDYAAALQRLLVYASDLGARFGFDRQRIQDLASTVQPSSLAGPAQALLSGVSGGLTLLLLIVTVTVFLAFETSTIKERLAVIGESRPHIAQGFRNFGERVRKYWLVTTVFGLIVAALDVIGLLIIGVPLYFTWGVLAFVTNYIPNVGFLLGLVPPALIALLDGGVGTAIAVVVVYTVINVVVQTIIQPRFTGDAVGISATVAFVSLIFWTYVLGTLGALLAIPCTLFVKSMLLDNSVPASWVNALISSAPKKERVDTVKATGGGTADGELAAEQPG
ncbi:AI-2E family transporter [Auraticoccus monumenti]|uniref:Predicted PurR-regulated permease PerM n=1 Tax=Auraticoccus monumenti TaxID=675864 RepID=A0A1G7ASA4_9ACTN|nr:AI-2E family transporter [Auraticoccus monumenti]SDE17774.1 Predicted PurR-regulated permease PerM [Auraticoccus monumenti]